MAMGSGASVRILRRLLKACLLCLLVALAGCDEIPAAWTAQRIPPLHVPHLQRLVGLSDLEGYSFAFQRAIPFQQAGGSMQALLIDAPTIAVAKLDGTGLTTIAQTAACDPWAAVAPSGQWVVCIGYDAPGTPDEYRRNQLEMFALRPSVSPRQWQADLDAESDYAYPTWSPDGAYLALTHQSSAGCAVTVYAFDTLARGAGSAALVTTLTSPELEDPTGKCAVTGMGWSPDGARLLLAARRTAECPVRNETTPIAQILRQATRSVVMPAAAFVPACGSLFTGSPDFPEVFWNPRSGALATGTGAGFALESSWGAHQVQVVALGGDTLYHIWSMTWTPDGRGLLLVVGPPQCTDHCSPRYLLDAYLYTAPSSASSGQ